MKALQAPSAIMSDVHDRVCTVLAVGGCIVRLLARSQDITYCFQINLLGLLFPAEQSPKVHGRDLEQNLGLIMQCGCTFFKDQFGIPSPYLWVQILYFENLHVVQGMSRFTA